MPLNKVLTLSKVVPQCGWPFCLTQRSLKSPNSLSIWKAMFFMGVAGLKLNSTYSPDFKLCEWQCTETSDGFPFASCGRMTAMLYHVQHDSQDANKISIDGNSNMRFVMLLTIILPAWYLMGKYACCSFARRDPKHTVDSRWRSRDRFELKVAAWRKMN